MVSSVTGSSGFLVVGELVVPHERNEGGRWHEMRMLTVPRCAGALLGKVLCHRLHWQAADWNLC